MMPEQVADRYRSASTPDERCRIQAGTIAASRPLIAALVKDVPARHRREGEQVAATGVLVALEKFDPAGAVSFRRLAMTEARRELARWQAAQ